MKVTVFMIIVGIIFLCIFVGLLTLIVRALLKYIHSKDVRQEKSVVRKSLGEALKVHRTQCRNLLLKRLVLAGRLFQNGKMEHPTLPHQIFLHLQNFTVFLLKNY